MGKAKPPKSRPSFLALLHSSPQLLSRKQQSSSPRRLMPPAVKLVEASSAPSPPAGPCSPALDSPFSSAIEAIPALPRTQASSSTPTRDGGYSVVGSVPPCSSGIGEKSLRLEDFEADLEKSSKSSPKLFSRKDLPNAVASPRRSMSLSKSVEPSSNPSSPTVVCSWSLPPPPLDLALSTMEEEFPALPRRGASTDGSPPTTTPTVTLDLAANPQSALGITTQSQQVPDVVMQDGVVDSQVSGVAPTASVQSAPTFTWSNLVQGNKQKMVKKGKAFTLDSGETCVTIPN